MSFLEEYGEADVRYERLGRRLVILLIAAILGGLVYYIFFRNWREERQVRTFLSLLEQQNYEQAYELWGCTIAEPCPYYPYEEFLEDWGPRSPLGRVESFRVGRSYTQNNGVIVTIEINGRPHDNLWVDAETGEVAFSPY